MLSLLAPSRAAIVVVALLSLAVASCASDDAGRQALAATTTLRAQMWAQVVRAYPASAAAGQARILLGSRESAARGTR